MIDYNCNCKFCNKELTLLTSCLTNLSVKNENTPTSYSCNEFFVCSECGDKLSSLIENGGLINILKEYII